MENQCLLKINVTFEIKWCIRLTFLIKLRNILNNLLSIIFKVGEKKFLPYISTSIFSRRYSVIDKKHKPFFINLDLITKSFRNRLFDSYKVGYWRLNKFKTVYEICLSLIDHIITSSSRYHRNFVADGPVTNNRERRKRMESAGVAFPPSPSAGFSAFDAIIVRWMDASRFLSLLHHPYRY